MSRQHPFLHALPLATIPLPEFALLAQPLTVVVRPPRRRPHGCPCRSHPRSAVAVGAFSYVIRKYTEKLTLL